MPLDRATEALIVRLARERGIPPNLAVAMAEQESGGDPRAIGDNGASVGLYQLHSAGLGAGLSVQQRMDPTRNATIALDHLAQTMRQSPGLDPGTLAARSQRPFDPQGYAQQVNQRLRAFPTQATPPPLVGRPIPPGGPTGPSAADRDSLVQRPGRDVVGVRPMGARQPGLTSGPPPQRGYVWPVAGYAPGTRISNPFGAPQTRAPGFTGSLPSQNNGLDIAVPQGTPILAPMDGRVVSVGTGTNYGYGNSVLMQDTRGNQWRLSHMRDAPVVRQGQQVRGGQTLGVVGMTGNATGPHLDLEFKPQGGGFADPLRQEFTQVANPLPGLVPGLRPPGGTPTPTPSPTPTPTPTIPGARPGATPAFPPVVQGVGPPRLNEPGGPIGPPGPPDASWVPPTPPAPGGGPPEQRPPVDIEQEVARQLQQLDDDVRSGVVEPDDAQRTRSSLIYTLTAWRNAQTPQQRDEAAKALDRAQAAYYGVRAAADAMDPQLKREGLASAELIAARAQAGETERTAATLANSYQIATLQNTTAQRGQDLQDRWKELEQAVAEKRLTLDQAIAASTELHNRTMAELTQQANAISSAGLEATQRGQDYSGAISQRGQDIEAGTATRGQDIGRLNQQLQSGASLLGQAMGTAGQIGAATGTTAVGALAHWRPPGSEAYIQAIREGRPATPPPSVGLPFDPLTIVQQAADAAYQKFAPPGQGLMAQGQGPSPAFVAPAQVPIPQRVASPYQAIGMGPAIFAAQAAQAQQQQQQAQQPAAGGGFTPP